MTNITELAQSLKAAAEKATPGRIGDRIDGSGSIKYQCFGNDGSLVLQTDHKNMEYGFTGPNAEADELFFRECAPENILALVEALESEKRICSTWRKTAESTSEKLEKAQRHANLTEAERQAYLGLISKQDERIAELESRTVKLPGWFVKDAIAVYDRDEIEEALAAAGIKWEAE